MIWWLGNLKMIPNGNQSSGWEIFLISGWYFSYGEIQMTTKFNFLWYILLSSHLCHHINFDLSIWFIGIRSWRGWTCWLLLLSQNWLPKLLVPQLKTARTEKNPNFQWYFMISCNLPRDEKFARHSIFLWQHNSDEFTLDLVPSTATYM